MTVHELQAVLYPDYRSDIQELVSEHIDNQSEKLVLAIYFQPSSTSLSKSDVYLLEVYDGWHDNQINPERSIMEIIYGTTQAFPMMRDQYLHLYLTNPPEMARAVEQDWSLIPELKKSFASKKAIIVAETSEAKELLERLRG